MAKSRFKDERLSELAKFTESAIKVMGLCTLVAAIFQAIGGGHFWEATNQSGWRQATFFLAYILILPLLFNYAVELIARPYIYRCEHEGRRPSLVVNIFHFGLTIVFLALPFFLVGQFDLKNFGAKIDCDQVATVAFRL